MKRTLVLLVLTLAFITCKSQDKAEVYLKNALKKINKQEYKTAILLLDTAISLDSGDPESYAFRGQAKQMSGNNSGALADYNKAIELQKDYAEVYHLRGIIKNEAGDKSGACADWNKALEYGFKRAVELLEKYCSSENKPPK